MRRPPSSTSVVAWPSQVMRRPLSGGAASCGVSTGTGVFGSTSSLMLSADNVCSASLMMGSGF